MFVNYENRNFNTYIHVGEIRHASGKFVNLTGEIRHPHNMKLYTHEEGVKREFSINLFNINIPHYDTLCVFVIWQFYLKNIGKTFDNVLRRMTKFPGCIHCCRPRANIFVYLDSLGELKYIISKIKIKNRKQQCIKYKKIQKKSKNQVQTSG